MPLVRAFIPVETAFGIRPRDLHYRERWPPVEADGLPEEGPVPAAINLPERERPPYLVCDELWPGFETLTSSRTREWEGPWTLVGRRGSD